MLHGLLRDSVAVINQGDVVVLQHPCWNLQLPQEWVDGTPGIRAFLQRSLTSGEVVFTTPETSDLLRLLEAQGCLTFRADLPAYTLRQVRELFRANRNEWYGYYYKHPLWQRLREGTLSENGLVAWLIYNYFLSRAAGSSAARLATQSKNRLLGQRFFRDVLAEYSHFSDFYFVRHRRLTIPDEAVEAYVQLPSSRAFAQHMLRLAETDWLGYVLIALFQESTVQFYDDCKKFFATVETNYSLEHFFDAWRSHIELDIECLHANALEVILESDEPVSLEQLIHSMTSAWFAFRFLVSSLDEILDQGLASESVTLRLPIHRGALNRATNALVRPYKELSTPLRLPTNCTALDLHRAMCTHGLLNRCESNRSPAPKRDVAFIRLDLVKSIYRALGYAETGDEIIALGRIAERAYRRLSVEEHSDLAAELQPSTSEAMAIATFFREMAIRPAQFCFSMHALSTVALPRSDVGSADWLPLAPDDMLPLVEFLTKWRLDSASGDKLITKQFEMNELVWRWQTLETAIAPPNFFSGREY